jgi:hypothetical protein
MFTRLVGDSPHAEQSVAAQSPVPLPLQHLFNLADFLLDLAGEFLGSAFGPRLGCS